MRTIPAFCIAVFCNFPLAANANEELETKSSEGFEVICPKHDLWGKAYYTSVKDLVARERRRLEMEAYSPSEIERKASLGVPAGGMLYLYIPRPFRTVVIIDSAGKPLERKEIDDGEAVISIPAFEGKINFRIVDPIFEKACDIQVVAKVFAKTVEEAQRMAIAAHPMLAIPSSPINVVFLSLYKRYKIKAPDFFKSVEWPLKLADEAEEAQQKAAADAAARYKGSLKEKIDHYKNPLSEPARDETINPRTEK